MFSAQDLLDDKQEQRPKEEEGKQTVWEDEHNSEFDTNEDDRNQEDEDEEEMEERERAEEAEEENPEMHKMKARSLVWKYFRKTLPAMAACSLCGKEICTVGNNTSGMIKHLSAIHYELNFQVKDCQTVIFFLNFASKFSESLNSGFNQ